MSLIRRIPIPMSALALGIAALGNLLLPYSPTVRAFCGVIAAVLVVLVALRIGFDFPGVLKELGNPAVLAVFPTFFMVLMLLAGYLKPYAATAATVLWMVALALQLGVSALFVVRHALSSKLPQVLPGWFLVFVGFVVASVTSPAFGMQALGRVLVYAGMAGYAGVLVLIVLRAVKRHALPEPVLPTVAILAAPPSLCLVGYLAVTQVKQPVVVYVLLALAAASLLYLIARLPRILTLCFYPTCAALTFPVVISAIALKQSSVFLATTASGSFIPKSAVMVMDGFALAMVLYALVRYAAFLAIPVAEERPTPVRATA